MIFYWWTTKMCIFKAHTFKYVYLCLYKTWSSCKELDCNSLGGGFEPWPVSGTPVITHRSCPDDWLAQFKPNTCAQRWPKTIFISFLYLYKTVYLPNTHQLVLYKYFHGNVFCRHGWRHSLCRCIVDTRNRSIVIHWVIHWAVHCRLNVVFHGNGWDDHWVYSP